MFCVHVRSVHVQRTMVHIRISPFNVKGQQYNCLLESVYPYTYKEHQSPRQSIVMKTSFETLVSRMRLGSFVDINILL